MRILLSKEQYTYSLTSRACLQNGTGGKNDGGEAGILGHKCSTQREGGKGEGGREVGAGRKKPDFLTEGIVSS